MLQRLTYANVMSTLAVFLALGGGGFAIAALSKNSVGPKQVRDNSLRSKELRNNKAVSGKDLIRDELHVVGTPGEPSFSNGGEGDCLYSSVSLIGGTIPLNPVGFYKDTFGTVHLTGLAGVQDGPAGDAMCGGAGESAEDARIYTLPTGYRPEKTVILQQADESTLYIIGKDDTTFSGDVAPAGSLLWGGTPPASIVLDSMSFRAADASTALAKEPKSSSSMPSSLPDSPGELLP